MRCDILKRLWCLSRNDFWAPVLGFGKMQEVHNSLSIAPRSFFHFLEFRNCGGEVVTRVLVENASRKSGL